MKRLRRTVYFPAQSFYLKLMTLLKSMLPPKMSRALPTVKSSFPFPAVFSLCKSSNELIPPAYVMGRPFHLPKSNAKFSSIPSAFPSASTACY